MFFLFSLLSLWWQRFHSSSHQLHLLVISPRGSLMEMFFFKKKKLLEIKPVKKQFCILPLHSLKIYIFPLCRHKGAPLSNASWKWCSILTYKMKSKFLEKVMSSFSSAASISTVYGWKDDRREYMRRIYGLIYSASVRKCSRRKCFSLKCFFHGVVMILVCVTRVFHARDTSLLKLGGVYFTDNT